MSTNPKYPLDRVLPVARHLLAALAPYCERIELAGSVRRLKPMVGDIELVAIPRRRRDLLGDPLPGPTVLDCFLDERAVQFAKRGEKYQQFAYGRYTVDLFLANEDTWGSIFTIRTGSADFSKWLVTAQPHGAAPWGLVFQGGRLHAHGRPLATPEEVDVFHALGLAYLEPNHRHGPLTDPVRIEPVWNYA